MFALARVASSASVVAACMATLIFFRRITAPPFGISIARTGRLYFLPICNQTELHIQKHPVNSSFLRWTGSCRTGAPGNLAL